MPLEGYGEAAAGVPVYVYNNRRIESVVPSSDPSGQTVVVESNSESGPVLADHSSTIYLHACSPPVVYEHEKPEEIEGPCGIRFIVGYHVRHHSGGTNWSFLDGHVKWLTPEQLAELSCSNPPLRIGLFANP
jgi:prepilin-type processing-associated H-X9-DG protein